MLFSSNSESLIKFRLDLILDLIKNDYQIVCASSNDINFNKTKKNLSKIGVILESYFISRNSLGLLNNFKTYKNIKLLIIKYKPDIIISYTVKPVIFSGIAIKNLPNIKFFPMVTGLGYAFTNFSLFTDFKKLIVRLILINLYKESFKKAKSIIFQNKDDKNLFIKLGIIKKQTPFIIINGSGVNLKEFKKTPYPRAPIFLMVSRLLIDKGIREYIESAYIVKKKYPHAKFLLVGYTDSNPSSIDIKKDILEKFRSNIEFYGYQDDIKPFLKLCKFFVLPSYREGTPRSILEALATGRAIITTNVPGCKNTVVDGRNGYLVNPRDAKNLSDAMIKLMNSGEANIKKMSNESFILAKKKFDVKKVNKDIINIICKYI